MTASTFFLSQRTGRWRWPWLLLSLPASALAIMATTVGALLALELGDALGIGWASEVDRLLFDVEAVTTAPSDLSIELAAVGITFWVAAIAGTLVHGRPVRSLVEPLRSFDWSIAGKVVTLQAGLMIVGFTASLVLSPLSRPDFMGVDTAHLIWLVPILLLTLAQTSGEDVFFKGYLLRQLGAATAVFWIAPVLVTLFFVSLHIGNTDVQDNLWITLPLFVVSDLVIIYFIMRTGGMEVAISWHWFNNITIFLLVAERTTQANDMTLFVFDEDQNAIADDLISGGLYLTVVAIQVFAFTYRRSPFFLPRQRWTPPDTPAAINTAAPR